MLPEGSLVLFSCIQGRGNITPPLKARVAFPFPSFLESVPSLPPLATAFFYTVNPSRLQSLFLSPLTSDIKY